MTLNGRDYIKQNTYWCQRCSWPVMQRHGFNSCTWAFFYASFYTDVFGNTHGSQQYLPSKSNRFYLIFTKRAVWVHYMETWAWDCIWVTTVNVAGVELVKNVVYTESNKFYLLFNKLALCGIGFRASSFKVKETRAENV